MKAYLLAWRFFCNHKLTRDEKRNFRFGGVVSAYGISFSIEKLLLFLACPLTDGWWFIIYGILSLLSLVFWFEDTVLDMWEHHTEEDDELYSHPFD